MNNKFVKPGLILLWVVCVVNLIIPFEAPWHSVFWWVGAFLVVAHAIECVVFAPRVRKAGGNTAMHFVQLFLFGVVHAQTLPR